jgi:glycosyltransferase involved in cell wall biosynthesis
MINAIIFQEIIPHYRVPLFNGIAESDGINLTIAYDGAKSFKKPEQLSFNVIPYQNKKLWKFFYIKSILKLIKDYDQIIFIADFHWLPTFIILLLFKGKRKLYFWGIGMSSQNGLRKRSVLDKMRFLLNDISSGTILYSKKIAEYYIDNVTKKEQVYVAANTIFVKKMPFSDKTRTKILSIGSFVKYKNLANLILAFNDILGKIPAPITLDFIGDGEQEEDLKALVNKLNLGQRVIFWGRKENDEEIFNIAAEAIVSVSPTQAGLSVLHSMALGCPYLTAHDAITGGERYYIEDSVNSYFYDGTVNGLADKLIWVINNLDFNNQIARNAYEFYHNNCNIDNYSSAFINILKSNENK